MSIPIMAGINCLKETPVFIAKSPKYKSKYSPELREAVLFDILSSDLTIREVALKHKIKYGGARYIYEVHTKKNGAFVASQRKKKKRKLFAMLRRGTKLTPLKLVKPIGITVANIRIWIKEFNQLASK